MDPMGNDNMLCSFLLGVSYQSFLPNCSSMDFVGSSAVRSMKPLQGNIYNICIYTCATIETFGVSVYRYIIIQPILWWKSQQPNPPQCFYQRKTSHQKTLRGTRIHLHLRTAPRLPSASRSFQGELHGTWTMPRPGTPTVPSANLKGRKPTGFHGEKGDDQRFPRKGRFGKKIAEGGVLQLHSFWLLFLSF